MRKREEIYLDNSYLSKVNKLFAINKLIQTLDKQAHSFNTIASQ